MYNKMNEWMYCIRVWYHTHIQACSRRLQRPCCRMNHHKLFPTCRQLWFPGDLHEAAHFQRVLSLHQKQNHSLLLHFVLALLRATCPNNFVTLLTCQPEPVFGHRLPVFLMFVHLAALLLVTAHLLQLVPGSETLSLVMLLLQHRCCHFVENWRHLFRQSYPDIVVWLAP